MRVSFVTPSTSRAISSPNSLLTSAMSRLRVLDDVVEQRCRQRLLVEMERGEDLRGAPRVPDEVLARAAALPIVSPLCERERPAQQVLVDVRLVRGDVRDQLLDEVLVPFLCLDDGHVPSVDGGPNEAHGQIERFRKE